MLLKNDNQIIRVLQTQSDQTLIIDCIKRTMPRWVDKSVLSNFVECSISDLYEQTNMIQDRKLTAEEQRIAQKHYTLIAGVLPFIGNEQKRSQMIDFLADQQSKQTIRKYLCLYLVYQEIDALAPPPRSEKELTQDEKNMRWALNKFFYTKHKNSLNTAYTLMSGAGFEGFSRGERGSTAEHLSSLEYKVKQDEKRLSELQDKIAGEQVSYDANHKAFMTFGEIDGSGKKTIMGKYTVSAEDYEKLTTLAKQSYSAVAEAKKLKEENRRLSSRIWSLESEVSRLKTALAELKEKCKPYLDALKAAPKAVKEFIDSILEKFKKQEKDIMYDPIPTDKPLPQKKPKGKDYER